VGSVFDVTGWSTACPVTAALTSIRSVQQEIKTLYFRSMKNRRRYIFLIYAFVVSLSFIFGLVGLNYLQETRFDDYRGILLGLSTELFGAFILFWLVDQFLHADELDAVARIESLTEQLINKNRVLLSSDDNQTFTETTRNGQEIWISSITGSRLLSSFERHIESEIRYGKSFRVLLTAPDSQASELIVTASSRKEFTLSVAKSLEICARLETIAANSSGRFELRVQNWIPSSSLIIVDPKTPKPNVRITFFPPNAGSAVDDRINVVLNPEIDQRWIDTYIEQFEHSWEKSKLFKFDDDVADED